MIRESKKFGFYKMVSVYLCQILHEGSPSVLLFKIYIASNAHDEITGGKQVAIKIQILTDDSRPDIVDEYRILRDLSDHPNLPDFYGVYKKVEENGATQIWFVMQVSSMKFY